MQVRESEARLGYWYVRYLLAERSPVSWDAARLAEPLLTVVGCIAMTELGRIFLKLHFHEFDVYLNIIIIINSTADTANEFQNFTK